MIQPKLFSYPQHSSSSNFPFTFPFLAGLELHGRLTMTIVIKQQEELPTCLQLNHIESQLQPQR